jgi:uncharacterized protein (TIGR00255 family)
MLINDLVPSVHFYDQDFVDVYNRTWVWIDESRFLQEVAILLVKYSINEELERLKAHIVEFNKLVELKEAVGKRIDFLTQEMNREINTIGSKSIIVEVNQTVVKMKESLENIREQIRNVE